LGRNTQAGDDRRDARVLGDSLRTDRHAFRPVSVDDPVIVELCEWSRMAEDAAGAQSSGQRMREQLWRYSPQMLTLGADDFAAEWLLGLRSQAPTPAKAARLRASTIERVLKAHRIRRWQAAEVLQVLKQQPLPVVGDVAKGASAHIRAMAMALFCVLLAAGTGMLRSGDCSASS
jgi:hypothetical protein